MLGAVTCSRGEGAGRLAEKAAGGLVACWTRSQGPEQGTQEPLSGDIAVDCCLPRAGPLPPSLSTVEGLPLFSRQPASG